MLAGIPMGHAQLHPNVAWPCVALALSLVTVLGTAGRYALAPALERRRAAGSASPKQLAGVAVLAALWLATLGGLAFATITGRSLDVWLLLFAASASNVGEKAIARWRRTSPPSATHHPLVTSWTLFVPMVVAAIGALVVYAAALPPVAFAVAALVVMASSAAALLRSTVTIGADGLLVRNAIGRATFVPLASIRRVSRPADGHVALDLGSSERRLAFVHRASVDAIEAAVARRRIAASAEDDAPPYRVRVESAEELGETLLDSAETPSVRVRAARQLASTEGAEAQRIRDEVADRVVDPEVRAELERERR